MNADRKTNEQMVQRGAMEGFEEDNEVTQYAFTKISFLTWSWHKKRGVCLNIVWGGEDTKFKSCHGSRSVKDAWTPSGKQKERRDMVMDLKSRDCLTSDAAMGE